MKQTQTKMFDFSDLGLDFCAGSKNLFPDRFKRMLAQGYNTQTVSSVVVTGNQVVLTYGVNHGYVADRVLKLNAANLTGEYVIDSVTSNTVTLTIDNAPTAISGGFTTFVAPLGWQLVYEQANIHIYKLKALDFSDLFLRLCFQDQSTRRNCISPCVGKSYDSNTGFITDSSAISINKSILTPDTGFKWELGTLASSAADNFTYAQGFSSYGLGVVVGSINHIAIMSNKSSSYPNDARAMFNAYLPSIMLDYPVLQKAILIGYEFNSITGIVNDYTGRFARAKCGEINLRFDKTITNTSGHALFDTQYTTSNPVLPSSIDQFNTTTLNTINVYETSNGQHIGYALGVYAVNAKNSAFPFTYQASPHKTYDIDLNNKVFIHAAGAENSATTNTNFWGVVLEGINYGS